ncbi:MAG: GAF domain-containing sensor histidine kinase [Cyanobacteria bacterium]|nr:GAF domain-containing sensor histidine kinase [Cyanobacteriota bacterium]MDA0867852.1 GAF domain-containing sensor histidine kinase [Cyanobacteriota bacterium]
MKQSTIPSVDVQAWQSPISLAGSSTQSAIHPMDIKLGSVPVSPSTANLLAPEILAVFEEATQMVSRFLNIPISMLGWVNGEMLQFQAAVGLSHLGFMNPLARSRQLALADPLMSLVWQQRQPLAIRDISADARATASVLVQQYGIQTYIGVPLITTQGRYMGLLMAMDTTPREFSGEAIAFMEMAARWSMSEYERYSLAQYPPQNMAPIATPPQSSPSVSPLDLVRLHLIGQLTEELRNPLTSITGMAGMLNREIYGPLTPKQQEYTEIVHQSSQQLLEMVDEIIELGAFHAPGQSLTATSVDVDMLSQQVLGSLTALAKHHGKTLAFTIEPGSRLWTLDKTVFKQVLYQLIFCVINGPGEGGVVKIHASRQNQALKLAVWLSHPWLGEGLPSAASTLAPCLRGDINRSDLSAAESPSREVLALLLSRHLIDAHGGTLTLQGNEEAGYRLIMLLPTLAAPNEV